MADYIKNLLLNDNKPENFTPTDLLLIIYLLTRHASEQEITDSWDTIAARLNCGRRAVRDSLARLEAAEWIIRSDHYAFDGETQQRSKFRKASRTVLNLAALPDGATPHRKPTAEAEKLAAEYYAILLPSVGINKKRLKTWHKVNEHAAQQLIDACRGKYQVAFKYIRFALRHSTFKKSASDSLREIHRRLPKLKRETQAWWESLTEDQKQEEMTS
jgi:hypothetical protein